MKVTIFKDVFSKEPHYVTIESVIDRIKTGKSKETIEKIRLIEDKKQRNEVKKQLPIICFSGIFEQRNDKKCKEHTGLICLDFDHVKDLYAVKENILCDSFVMAAFISPSGDGLKVVINTDATIETHLNRFNSIKKYYLERGLIADNTGDISRACFESFDNEVYFNPNATKYDIQFETKTDEPNYNENNRLDNDFEVFNILKKWIENKESYGDGNKKHFLVRFAAALNRYGISEGNAVSFLKNTYQNSASYVPLKEFENIVNDIYKRYSNHWNISFFDSKGVSYEKNTNKKTEKKVFDEYEIKDIITDEMQYMINKTIIDRHEPPKKNPVYFSLKKSFDSEKIVPIMTAGNISAIKGQMKSKKSFFISMIASTLLKQEPLNDKMYPSIPEYRPAIIHIDTEQSKYHVWRLNQRVYQMAQTNEDHFCSFAARGFDSEKIIQLIEYLLDKMPQISVIIIDQIADLTKSVNDEKEAIALLKLFEKLTNNYDIHICCVIHENFGTDKATGWLGSQILKKAETIIKLQKDNSDKSISTVSCAYSRDEDFDDFSFKINEVGIPEIMTNYINYNNI